MTLTVNRLTGQEARNLRIVITAEVLESVGYGAC